MAKERTGQVVHWIAEIGVIKDVEKLCAETEAPVLGELKLLLKTNVCQRGAKTAQDIATKIALLANRGRGESRLVENFPAGILRAKELERHSRVYVRAGREGGAVGEVN